MRRRRRGPARDGAAARARHAARRRRPPRPLSRRAVADRRQRAARAPTPTGGRTACPPCRTPVDRRIVALAGSVTSPLSLLNGWAIGGAASRVAPGATAVGAREAGFELRLIAAWPPGDPEGERHTAWVRDGWEALRPHSVGPPVRDFLVRRGPRRRPRRLRRPPRPARRAQGPPRPGQRLPLQRQHPAQRGRNPMNVLVTGATGTVGAHVVARAARARRGRARVRPRPRQAPRDLLGPDVELARRRLRRPRLARRARCTASTALFLACGNVPGAGRARVRGDRRRAARPASSRVVKLSGPRAGARLAAPVRALARRDRAPPARAPAVPWVLLRPSTVHDQPAAARRRRQAHGPAARARRAPPRSRSSIRATWRRPRPRRSPATATRAARTR